MAILEAQKLTKHYQMGEVTVVALDGIDLIVERGDFIAVMGPSGSGKSTLLHLFGGLDYPTSGEVYLNGQALSQLSDDEITRLRRKKVGFIFQFYNLLPTLNTTENVGLPLLIDGQRISGQNKRLEKLLELVGLKDRARHHPDQLSGGQQQRVAIARAFINAPEIVLADEPTGNLDSRSGTAILDLLRQTRQELNATIIMVTHDARAASYSDRVVFLKDGIIVHDLGNHNKNINAHQISEIITSLD